MSKAVVAQKSPYVVDVEAGKEYWWCACGLSKKQPFCDGSHNVTDFTPVCYIAEKNDTVFFCGCKQTGQQPVCDGTHSTI